MVESEVIESAVAEEYPSEDQEESARDASSAAASSSNTNENHNGCFSWMNSHHLGWIARIPGEWPRSCSLVFGVVIPLFVLIAISLFFGYALALLETPNEIEANNDIIANRLLIAAVNRFRGNVTEELPSICLNIFTQDKPLNETLEHELDRIWTKVTNRDEFSPSNITTELSPLPTSSSSNTSTLEMLNFMTACGKTAFGVSQRFVPLSIDQEAIGEELSFSWIRCDGLETNSSSTLAQQILGRPFHNRTRLKPNVQEAAAILRWRQNYHALYGSYREQMEDNGMPPVEASIQAIKISLKEANGFEHCYPNSAAGAWFWFTVMTTIGYGNTAPTTEGGRAMIYTLGFFSILLFAVVLGTAGTIIVTIWDDFINRTKLHHFNIPWVACLFWGFCYYDWMLVIAVVTQNWKAERLDEAVEFSEAYWFSYISTTTVGLGDYFLEHEVILRQDLFTFPLLFLTGFVFLANFFVKLTEVISNLVARNGPTLEETLAVSNAPCLPKMPRERLKALGIPRSKQRTANVEKSEQDEGMDDTDEGNESELA